MLSLEIRLSTKSIQSGLGESMVNADNREIKRKKQSEVNKRNFNEPVLIILYFLYRVEIEY